MISFGENPAAFAQRLKTKQEWVEPPFQIHGHGKFDCKQGQARRLGGDSAGSNRGMKRSNRNVITKVSREAITRVSFVVVVLTKAQKAPSHHSARDSYFSYFGHPTCKTACQALALRILKPSPCTL